MDWPTTALFLFVMGFAAFALVCLTFIKFIAWCVRTTAKTGQVTYAVITTPIRRR